MKFISAKGLMTHCPYCDQMHSVDDLEYHWDKKCLEEEE